MANYRALVIHKNVSGLPEDLFVNTLWFTHPAPHSDAADDIQEWCQTFFHAAGPNSIGAHLNSKVKRGVGEAEVRVYNMADAKPRPPEVRSMSPATRESGTDLPNEVAVAVSFYADRNIQRRRGRIYLGPLTTKAVSSGTADEIVSNSMDAAVVNGLNQVGGISFGGVWCVRSEVDGGAMRPVTQVWIDNALDTQRRRGADATSRWEHPFPVVG